MKLSITRQGIMTVNIENEYSGVMPEELTAEAVRSIADNVINEALDHEKCPYEIEVDLLLTDDDNIMELNSQFRSMDKSTDVLSFPLIDYESAADFTGFDELDELFNPDTGELMLGDIVISVDHCRAQAKEYGHGIVREFAFLIAHSMLHLMGYDHMTPEDAADMEHRQKEILDKLGYTR